MRAVRYTEFGGPDVLSVVDVDVPDPGPGQVRIKVKASGANPYDWKLRLGLMPSSVTFPAGVGQDAAGVVTAVGEGVVGVQVFDDVFGTTGNQSAAADEAVLRVFARSRVACPGSRRGRRDSGPRPRCAACGRWG